MRLEDTLLEFILMLLCLVFCSFTLSIFPVILFLWDSKVNNLFSSVFFFLLIIFVPWQNEGSFVPGFNVLSTLFTSYSCYPSQREIFLCKY